MTFSDEWMIVVNAIIVALFFVSLFWGYKKGLLVLLVDLISTLVALLVASLFASPFAKVFPLFSVVKSETNGAVQVWMNQHFNLLVWFVIVFLAVKVILLLIKPIINLFTKIPGVKQINSISGMIFSVFYFYLQMVLVCFILTFPFFTNGHYVIENSWLSPIMSTAESVFSFIEEPLENNVIFQKLISTDELSAEDKGVIATFLSENGLSEEDIVAFLSSLQ